MSGRCVIHIIAMPQFTCADEASIRCSQLRRNVYTLSQPRSQAFFSDKQVTSYKYVVDHFVKICGGHPQVCHGDRTKRFERVSSDEFHI